MPQKQTQVLRTLWLCSRHNYGPTRDKTDSTPVYLRLRGDQGPDPLTVRDALPACLSIAPINQGQRLVR